MKKLVYTAISKKNFYQKWRITKFVLEKGYIPINPFMLTDYYLADSVDHNIIRDANNALVRRCDEIWVFGEIADGVQREIDIAKKLCKAVRFFELGESLNSIKEISKEQVKFEDG